jgi:hypothetical protein
MYLSILAGSWLSERSFDANESRTSFTLGIMTPVNRANAPKAQSAWRRWLRCQRLRYVIGLILVRENFLENLRTPRGSQWLRAMSAEEARTLGSAGSAGKGRVLRLSFLRPGNPIEFSADRRCRRGVGAWRETSNVCVCPDEGAGRHEAQGVRSRV